MEVFYTWATCEDFELNKTCHAAANKIPKTIRYLNEIS